MSTQASPQAKSATKSKKGPIIGAVVLVLAIGAALAGYFLFRAVKHEPQAHKHVPKGALLASRVDGLKLVTFKPVRDHLWPVLLEDKDGGEEPDSERVDHIKEHTGITVTDLREVVTASLSATEWVMLVGGTIEPGRFVKGMDKVFEAEGIKGWAVKNEMLVHGTTSFALAQAEDGTLILATSGKLAKKCLPATADGSDLPLPVKGALSFALTHKAYDDAVNKIPLKLPGTAALSKINTLSGHMTLSEAPTVKLLGVPRKGADAKAVVGDMQSLISQLNLALLLVPGSLGGAKSAISNAKIQAKDGNVLINTSWPYKELDAAIKQLADGLRKSPSLSGK